MVGARPVVRRTCAVGAALFAGVTAAVGHSQGAPLRFLVLDTALGLLFVAAGLVAWERRPEVRTGPLLVASGVLWFVGSYAPTSLTPWADIGFAFERGYDVLLAFLVLTFPDVRLRGPRRVAVAAIAAAYVARVASRLLVDCQCTGGEHPFAPFAGAVLFDAVQAATSAVTFVAAVAVVSLAIRRLLRAAPAARRVLGPVVAAGSIAGLVAAFDAAELAVYALLRAPLLPFGEPWLEIVSWTVFGAVTLVPLGFLAGAWRLRLRHGSIGRLAIELGAGADLGRLQAALRHALGDPTVDLYLRDDSGAWTTATGERREVPADDDRRAVTILSGDAGPIAAVAHDAVLREDPGLVAAATAVLRLAVENDRLTAVVRGQLDEVRASRARLVEAAELERRRIERNLHDGAQQRLIAVALALQEAQEEARRADPDAPFVRRLDDASAELLAAVDELRELARGIHPAILSEEGLRPAVGGLARRSAVPVRLDVRISQRLPAGVETAVYYVVAEALTNIARHARAREATVAIAQENGSLVVEVADDGDGGADASRGTGLEGIADRLGALSGTLEVDSQPGRGTRVRAVIPCG